MFSQPYIVRTQDNAVFRSFLRWDKVKVSRGGGEASLINVRGVVGRVNNARGRGECPLCHPPKYTPGCHLRTSFLVHLCWVVSVTSRPHEAINGHL